MKIVNALTVAVTFGLLSSHSHAERPIHPGTRASVLSQTVPPNHVLPQPEMIGDRVGGFTRAAAVEQCARKGLRLPTVRELASWGATKGSQIRESANKEKAYLREVDLMQRDGFKAVYLHHTYVQTVVDFYYNPSQHKLSGNTGLARFAIWAADNRHVDGMDGYQFFAGSGVFMPSYSGREHAVSCVVQNFMQQTSGVAAP